MGGGEAKDGEDRAGSRICGLIRRDQDEVLLDLGVPLG